MCPINIEISCHSSKVPNVRTDPAKPPPHVAVCVDKARGYGRGVLQGIADYIEAFGPWSLFIEPDAIGRYGERWLADWKGDGVLAYIEDPAFAQQLRRRRIPAVELFGHRDDLGLPQVANDDVAIGRLAAQHFLDRQFKNFAFTGYPDEMWVRRRLAGFQETVAAGGAFSCEFFPRNTHSLADYESNQSRLRQWLHHLPKPVALMACSDRHAQRVLDACRIAGISVPEEIAVIGVDNDEQTCRLTNPPLSSVIDNPRKIGFEAARMLGELMHQSGRHRKAGTIHVAPIGIATRLSTDITATEDPLVARALQMIRERTGVGLTADELALQLNVSRSVLFRRFRKTLGRTPLREINRVLLERVKTLLKQKELTLETVASMTGFDHPEYLSVLFKRETGMTPGTYRRESHRRLEKR